MKDETSNIPLLNYKGELLLPPSPNWFEVDAVDSREADRLLVSACFKTIIVSKVEHGYSIPVLLKNIPHFYGKVITVKLYPDVTDATRQSYLLATGEKGTVTLYDIEKGTIVGQNRDHVESQVKGLCWLTMEDNSVKAVSADNHGLIGLWDVSSNICKMHKFTPKVNSNQKVRNSQQSFHFSVIESVPHQKGHILVASDQDICHIDMNKCEMLSRLKGHRQLIYSIKWCPVEDPFLRECIDQAGTSEVFKQPGRGSSSSNWRSTNNWPTRTTERFDGLSDFQADNCIKGPSKYVASTDLSGTVYLWDFSTQRYIYHTTFDQKRKGIKPTKNWHVAPAWYKNKLLVGNYDGEIFTMTFYVDDKREISCKSALGSSDELMKDTNKSVEISEKLVLNSEKTMKEEEKKDERSCNDQKEKVSPSRIDLKKYGHILKTLHKEHVKAVFNLNIIGNMLVSNSQDRNLIGYCLDKSKIRFTLPSIGCSLHSMSFNPHTSNWLALGMNDQVKLIDLHGNPPIKHKLVSVGRGRVLSMAWHPRKDSLLLVGTGEGLVGLVDVGTKKVKTFSSHHQNCVYNVGWAPKMPISWDQMDTLPLYAYSFGDRDVMCRDPNDLVALPVNILHLVPSLPKNITEFSFSHDYKYLACGCHDGEIYIINTKTLQVLMKLLVVRKSIQHIVWQPKHFNNQEIGAKYLIAIASNDTKICIQKLDSLIEEREEKLKGENPKEIEIISSCTRELNGHCARVVHLAFSPHNSDFIVSASYDHTCQVWAVSSGEMLGNYRGHLSRAIRAVFSPDQPGLLYSFGEDTHFHQWRINDLSYRAPPEKICRPFEQKVQPVNKNPSSDEGSPPRQKAPEPRRRHAPHRSLLPLLHRAASHKRGFFLASSLSLAIHNKEIKEEMSELPADMTDPEDVLLLNERIERGLKDSKSTVPYFEEVMKSHSFLIEESDPNKKLNMDDVATFLEFYGPTSQMSNFVDKQIEDHFENDNFKANSYLGDWQFTYDQVIEKAIAEKKLTAEMVYLAGLRSRNLLRTAAEAYARQLVDSGDFLLAATTLAEIDKKEEAVDILLENKLFREALCLVKTRFPFEPKMKERILRAFANQTINEGHYDMTALLFCSLGEGEAAAGYLTRRGDAHSLYTAGLLYQKFDSPNTNPTFLECLKISGAKLELEVMENVLKTYPSLGWFGPIHMTLVHLVQNPNILLTPSMEKSTLPPLHDRDFYFHHKDGSKENILDALYKKMFEESKVEESYYADIFHHLVTSSKPTTLRSLWYHIGIEITKLLMAVHFEYEEDSKSYMKNILKLLVDWGRHQSLYEITHFILPNGVDDVPTCLGKVLNNKNEGTFKFLRQLHTVSVYISMSAHLESTLESASEDESNDSKSSEQFRVLQEFLENVYKTELDSTKSYELLESDELCRIPEFKEPRKAPVEFMRKLGAKFTVPSSLLEYF